MKTKYHLVRFNNGKYGVRRTRFLFFGAVRSKDYAGFHYWHGIGVEDPSVICWKSESEAKANFMSITARRSKLEVDVVIEELVPKRK